MNPAPPKKRTGRPPTPAFKLAAAAEAVAMGIPWRAACREFGVTMPALARYLKAAPKVKGDVL